MTPTSTYKETSVQALRKLKKDINILLVTVTPVESKALHSLLKPLPEEQAVLKGSSENLTYNVGVLGKYRVCHVVSKMGSVAAGGSLMTIHQAITDWSPKVIIMLGIAFGKDKETQNIGDVLVARHIQQYQHKKITKSGKTEDRGDKHHCSPTLLDRFSAYHDGWSYSIADSVLSVVRIGDVLSGEVLIDNEKYRNKLFEKYSEAIGGEMEGVGVANAALTKAREWIVVKGICDFADGEKGKHKTQYQQLAAGAAASLCEFIFNHSYVFKSLKINALLEPSTQQQIQASDIIQETPLDEVVIPKIPGLTDNDMQANRKLIRAFLSLTVSSRFHIGTLLGLVDPEEIENGNTEEVSTQILVRAKEQNLFGQLWSALFDEKNDPNPFK